MYPFTSSTREQLVFTENKQKVMSCWFGLLTVELKIFLLACQNSWCCNSLPDPSDLYIKKKKSLLCFLPKQSQQASALNKWRKSLTELQLDNMSCPTLFYCTFEMRSLLIFTMGTRFLQRANARYTQQVGDSACTQDSHQTANIFAQKLR